MQFRIFNSFSAFQTDWEPYGFPRVQAIEPVRPSESVSSSLPICFEVLRLYKPRAPAAPELRPRHAALGRAGPAPGPAAPRSPRCARPGRCGFVFGATEEDPFVGCFYDAVSPDSEDKALFRPDKDLSVRGTLH